MASMISCNLRWCDGHNMFEMYKSCFKHALCCPRCSNKGKLREFLPGGSSFLTIAVDSFGISTSLTSVDMATWSFEGQKTLEKNEPNLPILRHTEKRITKLLGLLLSKLIRRFKDKKSVLLMSYLCAPHMSATMAPPVVDFRWGVGPCATPVRLLCWLVSSFSRSPSLSGLWITSNFDCNKARRSHRWKMWRSAHCPVHVTSREADMDERGCGRSNKEAIKFPAIPKWQHLGRTRSD